MVWEDRPQMTIRKTHAHCNTINTHPQYVIFIAFPLQKWLHGTVEIT